MKKILSLFLSLILALSVCVSSVSVFARADEQISLAKVHLDVSGNNLKVVTHTSTTKKIGDKIIIYGPAANSKGETNVFDNASYFGENAVIVTQSQSGSSESGDMRFQISMGGMNTGKTTFTYDLYMATDDSCRMNLRLRSGSSYLSTVSLTDLGLNPFEWYTMKIIIDFASTSNNCQIVALKSDGSVFNSKTFTCNFTGKALDNMFIWGTPKSDGMPQGAPDAIKDELAFYAMKNLLIYRELGDTKAKILSVGSAGEVNQGQKEVTFNLSKEIAGLTKDHVLAVTSDGQEIAATGINVATDGGNVAVTATLESDLAPETNYTLKLKPECYSGYKEIYNGEVKAVTPLEFAFYTTKAPIDDDNNNDNNDNDDNNDNNDGDDNTDLTSGIELALVQTDTSVLGLNVTEKNGLASTASNGTITFFGIGKNTDGTSNVFSSDTLFGTKTLFVGYGDTTVAEGDLTNGPRMQIRSNSIGDGVAVLEAEFYLGCEIDNGNFSIGLRCDGKKSRDDKVILSPTSNAYNLSPYKWYNLKIEADYTKASNNFVITIWDETSSHTEIYTFSKASIETVDQFRLIGTPISDEIGNSAPQELNGQKAFYAFNNIRVYKRPGLAKANIVEVASDGVAMYGSNELSFELSEYIAGLTKDHVVAVNDGGQENKATEISVASDGGKVVVTATLENNLAPWSDYTLKLEPGCYSEYKEVYNGVLRDITPIEKEFSTPSAPFDMKDPEFVLDGSALKAQSKMINSTGTPKDVCLVFASFTSDGVLKNVEIGSYSQFEADYPGSDVSVSAVPETNGYLRLFVVDSLSGRIPYFGKSWTVDGSGNTVAYDVTAMGNNSTNGTITVGEFDYDNLKIAFDLNSGTNAATDGVIAVYKDGETVTKSNLEYFDYILTSANGTYSKEITFDKPIAYGTYTIEFTSSLLQESVKASFTYYSPSQILDNKKQAILHDVKAAPTAGVVMQVILGINENEEIINDNFDVFSADANLSYYSKLKNKDEVFALIKSALGSVNTYSDLVTLFNTSAQKQYQLENTQTSSPSSNNKNYGSTSNVISQSKPTQEENPQTPLSGSASKFTDMNGHWAEKFAAALAEKGIITGYADGTFRGDNVITRAELAKILAETFAGSTEGNNAFNDVAGTSWYAPYIAKAANAGIIKGFDDGSFRPETEVTKEDAIVMLYRALLLENNLPTGYALFTDDLEISSYAQEATRCLGELGIVTGDSNKKLSPKNNITRAEVAALICRSLDYTQAH